MDDSSIPEIRELFSGRKCCKCGEQAARIRKGRFYCLSHYLKGCTSDVGEPRTHKLHMPRSRGQ